MSTSRKPLNRDALKLIAILLMTLNHVAHVFLRPHTPLYEVFVDAGYFTAPAMAWLLVEGFGFTRSRPRYALRLLGFAVLAQAPFMLAFHIREGNVLVTLLLCFLMLWALESPIPAALKALAAAAAVILSRWCDWSVLLPVGVLIFRWAQRAPSTDEPPSSATRRAIAAWLLFCAAFIGYNWFSVSAAYRAAYAHYLLRRLLQGCLGPLSAGMAIVLLYNGRRSARLPRFFKWFFYLYYPSHLAALCLIRALMA